MFEADDKAKAQREGLKTFVHIIRYRKLKWKKRTREDAYFISDLPTALWPEFFWNLARNHWWIENKLHYPKDVTLLEDKSKIHTWNQPANISFFRNIALNLFRKIWYKNMAQAMRIVSNDIELMASLNLA